MSSFIVALVCAIGAGVFTWSQLERVSGNADPKKIIISSAISGLIVFIFLFTLLKWMLHIG
jgi:hypothetical protein